MLIAEDEALIRLDLAEMLREEGYQVVGEAGDGQEAVELAETLRPDLVIMDVKMPRRDGIDAAAEIAGKRIAPVVITDRVQSARPGGKARDAARWPTWSSRSRSVTWYRPIEVAVSRSRRSPNERSGHPRRNRLEARKLIERAKGLLQAKRHDRTGGVHLDAAGRHGPADHHETHAGSGSGDLEQPGRTALAVGMAFRGTTTRTLTPGWLCFYRERRR